MYILYTGGFIRSLYIISSEIEPVFWRHILEQVVLAAAMIEFHTFGVSRIYQFAEFFIVTEAAVYLIVIGDGIAMVWTFFHIIFLDRVEPDGSDTQIVQVIQMIFDTFQVTAMACKRFITVYFCFEHSRNNIVRRGTIGKTVRHNQIKYITGIESFYIRSIVSTLFNFVRDNSFFFTLFQSYIERLGSRFRQIHI